MAIISIKVTALDLTALAGKLTDSKIMAQVGSTFLRLAMERAGDGTGSDRTKLPAYSKAYAKKRADSGRDADNRTLNYHGDMLAARTLVAITEESVTVGWTDPEQAAKAEGNEEIVQAKGGAGWIQPTIDEREYLAALLENEIRAKLRAEQAAAPKKAVG